MLCYGADTARVHTGNRFPVYGKVGLVLSGGGAKGLSHIGVIRAIEESCIPIDYICGTSMGAVIASLYAMGLSPDEITDIVKSKEFEAWSTGRQEADFATYFYRDEPLPEMFSVSLRRDPWHDNGYAGKRKLRVSLPSSIVSPYPMDLAMIETYASPSIACNFDFSNLMVPFFCISADILNKRKVVHTEGDLGAAVRASMTYPFIFKPITIDSTVLFDGGFYDNFPWKELDRLHSPDFIIGSRCVADNTPLDDENIVGHITNMITSRTDFDIPPHKGIVIGERYPYGVMEFDKADEIIAMGYADAKEHIPLLKELVGRERSRRELDSMRLCFRQRTRPLRFGADISFEGTLSGRQKEFVRRAIAGRRHEDFDFSTLKRGYYKVAASGTMKTFYPYYELEQDSITTLKIKASCAAPLKLFIGGNISSANLNQGYAGALLQGLGKYPWSLLADVDIGKFHLGGSVKWRHNIGVKPLAYYDLEAVGHSFSYTWPYSEKYREFYVRGGAAVALSERRNLMLKGNLYFGKYSSLSLGISKNTYDKWHYPSEGVRLDVAARWRSGGIFRLRGRVDAYIGINRYLRLGYCADVVFQNRVGIEEYIPSLMQMPAFTPFPHSSTLLLQEYRANTYLGVGISPVICAAKTLFLHCNISYFQPYRKVTATGDGGYGYSGRFPKGAFLGNVALVWHSPAGPVSLSASYYQRGERYKWYPQLNVGFFLFKKKMMED